MTVFKPQEFEDGGGFVSVILTHQATTGAYLESIDATEIDFQDQGVLLLEDQGGSPKVYERHFVPWAHIHRIHQVVS